MYFDTYIRFHSSMKFIQHQIALDIRLLVGRGLDLKSDSKKKEEHLTSTIHQTTSLLNTKIRSHFVRFIRSVPYRIRQIQ